MKDLESIDACIREQRTAEAVRLLAELWRSEPGPAAAAAITSRYEQLRTFVPLAPYRLAILRSFTVEPLTGLLRAACFVAGIDLEIEIGQFNAYAQEILDPVSALYQFRPNAVILAVDTRDVAPKLWSNFGDLAEDEASRLVSELEEDFRTWIGAFRAHSEAHLILHTLEEPPDLSYGIADDTAPLGQADCIRRVNARLKSLAAEFHAVHVLDYDALVARHGRAHWHDERKWIAVRLPLAASHLLHLVNEWMRFLHPLTGRVSKAVVVDLDDTLWGGVLGEVGIRGLQAGAEDGGAAFTAVQRALLDLRARGVLLCVCSKNNAEEALAALESHPGMLLRPHHFSAFRINWKDKAENLRELAAELNIGTDALAFLDDNPVERERVRIELPEVHVIELPANPAGYSGALRSSPVFERLHLSNEDLERPSYYAHERSRAHLLERSASREDFLRSLDQRVRIFAVDEETLARAAQLTAKTNQFNLTTRRYTALQLAELGGRPDWQALGLRVRDRFGDSGFVGLAIVHHQGEISQLDTLLLSCRVIGRSVETALLMRVAAEAHARGARSLHGWFFPTKANQPAGEFYSQNGFSMVSQDGRGSLWSLDLMCTKVTCPDWIAVEFALPQINHNGLLPAHTARSAVQHSSSN